MKKSTYFKNDKNQYCKDLFPPQIDLYIQSNPSEIPIGFFHGVWQSVSKIHKEEKMYKNRRG